MAATAPHAFIKSHTIACALTGYRAAYLKTHFMAQLAR
jgi:DNA polymerase III alpha subunit